MNKFLNIIFTWTAVLCIVVSGCSDDDMDFGISDIENPKNENVLSFYGETVTVSFMADGAWNAELSVSENENWVRIAEQKHNSEAGKGSVRIVFDKNKGKSERSVELFVTVSGHDRMSLCTFTQEASQNGPVSEYLNKKMHEELLARYLWNGDYKELSDKNQIDFDLDYEDFLFTNLTKLGETNIEDGGRYRDFSAQVGQRYIYSNIQEIDGTSAGTGSVAGKVSAVQTRASGMRGLGMGPTLAMGYTDPNTRCLILGYVYPDSPAERAGLQRGDLIIGVNGSSLDPSNYQQYQQELYTTTSGIYTLKYGRYDEETGEKLIEYETTVAAGSFNYNPIIFAGLFQNEELTTNIGYLVLESFDLSAQELLKEQLEVYQREGIKDLILDLRFNPGGAVAQCRYLMSSIVGPSNYSKTFAKMTYNDGTEEEWSFGFGDTKGDKNDQLGQGPDLKLTRLHVICSENTGSAAEIVINSLKGIDFPVTTYGSRTEGKNVGMVTSQMSFEGRRFEFAPITFYVKNAKDKGDYKDGFEADKPVNNQNSNWNDDIDRYFPYGTGDWELALQADPAVIWAVQNITEGTDPDFTETKSKSANQVKTRAAGLGHMYPVPNVPIRPKMGRFGNIIYGSDVE